MRYLIAVSGPIAVGKSAVISKLEERFGVHRISTRLLIQCLRDVPSERKQLQDAGEALDRETDGKWVADALVKRLKEFPNDSIVVLDSIRIVKQATHLRRKFGKKIWHVHLTASEDILTKRYVKRKDEGAPSVQEPETYREARASATEANIESLSKVADVSINTDRLEPGSVATLAMEKLNLFSTTMKPLVDVIVGGQYGSEGKGNICDYLAKEYGVLVRVGGPNAGHKVAAPFEYDYVQMPSGTGGNPKASVFIGAGATLDIERVKKEIAELKLDSSRLSIDPQAIVIEQSDRDAEEKLGKQIGSTKKGVGIATARKIVGRGGDPLLDAKVRLANEIPELKSFIRSVTAKLEDAYVTGKRIMLEGTQGTDLSIHHGIYPSVTSRETTASGCLADAGISPRRVRKIYMVTRTYPIRVGGDSGEMGIEIDFKTIAERSGLSEEEIRKTEIGTISGKTRRIAEFSWDRVRRAAQINGATDIVLTFADYIDGKNRKAKKYENLSSETKKFISKLERITGVPVSIISVGFGRNKIIDRRKKK